jgi:hypothetical protein
MGTYFFDYTAINYFYRFILFGIAVASIIILSIEIKKNKSRRGFVYPAILYFISVTCFYFARILNFPENVLIGNLISNVVRTIGEFTIFFMTYILIRYRPEQDNQNG